MSGHRQATHTNPPSMGVRPAPAVVLVTTTVSTVVSQTAKRLKRKRAQADRTKVTAEQDCLAPQAPTRGPPATPSVDSTTTEDTAATGPPWEASDTTPTAAMAPSIGPIAHDDVVGGAEPVPEKRPFVDRRTPGNYVSGRNFVAPQVVRTTRTVPSMPSKHATPFIVAAFAAGLARHENQDYAEFVVTGLDEGFRLNTTVPEVASTMEPLKTALLNEEAVEKYLAKEVELERMFVFDDLPHPFTLETALGVVPKKSYTAAKQKWRIISHFSKDLEGGQPSVNASIDPDDYSMELVRIEEIMETMRLMGSSCTLTVADCDAGYRQVPVHPDNYHHQVYRWKGKYYVDTRLTFGSRASPLSYACTSGAMEYIIQATLDAQLGLKPDGTRRAVVFSFIDDFLVLAEDPETGAEAAKLLFSEMDRLGVPLSMEKSQGKVNVTELEYLGMYLDAKHQEVSLPKDKRDNLKQVLGAMAGKRLRGQPRYQLKKPELQSIVGKLTYAHLVMPLARPWINPMLAAICRQPQRDGYIQVTEEVREAAEQWLLMLQVARPRPTASLPYAMAAALRCGRMADGTGDASGNEGFGFWLANESEVYFDQWEDSEKSSHTLGEQFVDEAGRQSSTLQEGKCMMAAALTWAEMGDRAGQTFIYQSDSRNLVHLQRKGRSRTKAVNELWKRLTLVLGPMGAFVHVVWVSREESVSKRADMLSRCDLTSYNQALASRLIGSPTTAVRSPIAASTRKLMVG